MNILCERFLFRFLFYFSVLVTITTYVRSFLCPHWVLQLLSPRVQCANGIRKQTIELCVIYGKIFWQEMNWNKCEKVSSIIWWSNDVGRMFVCFFSCPRFVAGVWGMAAIILIEVKLRNNKTETKILEAKKWLFFLFSFQFRARKKYCSLRVGTWSGNLIQNKYLFSIYKYAESVLCAESVPQHARP